MRLRTQGGTSPSTSIRRCSRPGEGLGLEQQGVAGASADPVDAHVGAGRRRGIRDVFDVGIAERELRPLALVAEDAAGYAGPAADQILAGGLLAVPGPDDVLGPGPDDPLPGGPGDQRLAAAPPGLCDLAGQAVRGEQAVNDREACLEPGLPVGTAAGDVAGGDRLEEIGTAVAQPGRGAVRGGRIDRAVPQLG